MKPIDSVQLEEGKSYKLKVDGKEYAFTVEAGGIMSGEDLNGSAQVGKLIFKAGEIDYEGSFSSPTQVQLTESASGN